MSSTEDMIYSISSLYSSLSLSLRVKGRLATTWCEIGAIIVKDDLEGGNCLDDLMFKNNFLKGGNKISLIRDLRIWCMNHRLLVVNHRWERLGWFQRDINATFGLVYVSIIWPFGLIVLTPHSLTKDINKYSKLGMDEKNVSVIKRSLKTGTKMVLQPGTAGEPPKRKPSTEALKNPETLSDLKS